MADPVTVVCASAAAAAANACGAPPEGSIIAAVLGGAASQWLQAGAEAELTVRWSVRAMLGAAIASGVGLLAGAMVPPLLPSWALVPGWAIVGASACCAHLIIPLTGGLVARVVGGAK